MVSSTSPRGIALQRAQADLMRDRITRVWEDYRDLTNYFSIEISSQRMYKLRHFLESELLSLHGQPFEFYDQQDKVDYLLLQNYLQRQLRSIELNTKLDENAKPLFPFSESIVSLCEARAAVVPLQPKHAAEQLFETRKQIADVTAGVEKGEYASMTKSSAFRGARIIDSMRHHLEEWYGFYKGYDPMFDWWVVQPYEQVDESLKKLEETIKEKLVGITPGDEDTIVGEPIGQDGLLAELEAEVIPYTPEEIIKIGEREFTWCVDELKKASRAMGYADDWQKALEKVKNDYVEPGQQTQLVRTLAQEAIAFVEDHHLVTVPAIAKDTWQTFMMSPERQKMNPFFLGGESIIVSYPTDTMDHGAKMMSMRGNNIHFSRATVFHELIPGHHLQFHVNARHRPYRLLFDTPFWVEGWSLYWEMILWDDERFKKTPENRMGMLFWRLHRCARIIFSINFHLGKMTPEECVELLVQQVGHERATAEGEVRRSLSGDYSPLYQAGYMLGALQIYALRKELIETNLVDELAFHDRFLRENRMPIELFRALMLNLPLSREYQARWRFYGDL
ncbi:hypothetical protein P168DRAFT_286084 [Aspergillus campestris IBT 28561]|uniref:X-Pro dipeptidyl-peptidase n=1 Tax=Aspergillus campestris (strain IBT 28561) TaxID=1392248 RepID=A0A2I1DDH8_ASPC2|nr:uncharacterized protein P168DRAFT_286084 [Aspergillus campestris IBT 28561]PKY07911.1 hypothetical protein P168DRAFT_286084 [Aspergillus campestris IBT 28561]